MDHRLAVGDLGDSAALRRPVRFELDLFRRLVMESDNLPDIPMADLGRDATELGEQLIIAIRSRLLLSEIQHLTGQSSAPEPKRDAKKAAAKPKKKKKTPAKGSKGKGER